MPKEDTFDGEQLDAKLNAAIWRENMLNPDQNAPQPPADLYEQCNEVAGTFVAPSAVELAYAAGYEKGLAENEKLLERCKIAISEGAPRWGDESIMQEGLTWRLITDIRRARGEKP